MAARARARGAVAEAKPRSDVYTGLLLISLLAMLVASVLLYLDYSQYDQSKPPAAPTFRPPQTDAGGGQTGLPGPAEEPQPQPPGPDGAQPGPMGGGQPAPMPPGGNVP